jgi:hypothetical protein
MGAHKMKMMVAVYGPIKRPAPLAISLDPGWETLSPNSPHHVKTKKLGCSIENLKKIYIKIRCLNKFFQNM